MQKAHTSEDMRAGAVGLVALSIFGWVLILWSVRNMGSPIVALMMPMDVGWRLKEVFVVWLMWSVMMGAMMLPSAIPMIMIHRRISAKRNPEAPNANRWFLLAYIVAWALFSAGASVLQWGFQRADILSPMLKLQGSLASGIILVAAGLFQFSSLKTACLHKCRTPMGFVLTDWRSGNLGAFHMGLKHGQYCIGCCWALMMVLFVGGAMSLTTIAVLSCIVAIEKLAPRGDMLAKIGGLALIAWGLWLLSTM